MRYEQIERYFFGAGWLRNWKCWGWLVVLAGLGWGIAPAKELPAPESVFGKLPLYFVENRGQAGGEVAYQTLGGDHQAHFAATGVWLTQTQAARRETDAAQSDSSPLRRVALHREPSRSWALKLEFLGAREVTPRGVAPAETKVSDFRGKPERWRTGLATHTELVYPDLWSGIDLRYGGDKGRLKSTFAVKPGADPGRIRLAWRGAERVALTDAGRLRVETPLGIIEEDRPVAWQEREGRRVPVAARYALETDSAGGWRYGFELGEYDPALPLVIDPVTLGYAGFLGGGDTISGIVVDSAGAAYVTGQTYSGGFPNIGGSGDASVTVNDVFVAKIKPDGSGLVYASLFGGRMDDTSTGIAVDSAGAAYVAGQTYSDDFPVVGGPDGSFNGFVDTFVVKIKPDGSGLAYAGFIGGGEGDSATGIAVDSAGAAYVAGTTQSGDFPTVGGLGLSFGGGDSDAFVVKVKPDGSGLAYAGFIGGGGIDSGAGIAVDGTGAAYVAGTTWGNNPSDNLSSDFPAIVGPDVSFNGSEDVFVAKVKPDGSGLAYSGFLGGNGYESVSGIAMDHAGAAYVAGNTNSTDFPTLGGLDKELKARDYGAKGSIFVTKIKPDGSGLAYSGFIGWGGCWREPVGSRTFIRCEESADIAVDEAGAAYVGGVTTYSKDLPIIEGTAFDERSSGFVAKVKPDASGLAYTALLGRSITVIAVDSAGAAYVAGGLADPQDLPIIGGLSGDGRSPFVAKIVETAAPTPPIVANDSYTGYGGSSGLSIAIAAPGVLRNDFSSDGGRLTASVVNAPGRGTLQLDADGSFTYTPVRGYSGTDRFTYIASNSVGDSVPATVTLELVQPQAVNDRFERMAGSPTSYLFGNILQNDTHIIAGVATAVVNQPPRHGSLTLEPDGTFTYTPNQGYRGRDSFTYAIKYGSATSRPARVILIMRRP